jgi:glycosyltransferase involved in cell wall biosynthesis
MSNSLYIAFNEYQSLGGVGTFMANLKHYLDSVKFPYTTDINSAQHIFFPINFDFEQIKKIKAKGGKVIQRMDGVHYPTQHGPEYINLNKLTKDIYRIHSNFVVFQTEYSRRQCFVMYGERPVETYSIIVNGANLEMFYPDENRQPDKKLKLITVGNFRKQVMLEPIMQALDLIGDKALYELTVVGPIAQPELKAELLKRKYVNYIENKSSAEIAEILRQHDLYIHTNINDLCPNSVIEAVSSGLPVVGYDSGAMKELLPFSADLLAFASHDFLQLTADFKPQPLAEKITQAIENYSHYRKLSLDHARSYDFASCGASYVEVFNRCTNS